jgi:hypothetical protein
VEREKGVLGEENSLGRTGGVDVDGKEDGGWEKPGLGALSGVFCAPAISFSGRKKKTSRGRWLVRQILVAHL